ncbi:hypothetical protein ABTX24_26265 [Nocardioides sp. NPDC127514]|uniref:hypothetical protein n=1 Tax=unclassified Nocardioides TaxID=2615069 RepID=UPI00331F9DB2
MALAITVIGAAGAAFIAGFFWRDVVIGMAALRWANERPVSRRALLTGYCTSVTSTPAARVTLAAASLTVLIAAIAPANDHDAAIRLTCVGCLALVVLGTTARTWPNAKRLSTGEIASGAESRAVRELTVYQSVGTSFMLAVVALLAITAGRDDALEVIAGAGAAFLAATLWNEVLIDGPFAVEADAMSAADRSTLLGYYAAMTAVAARPNLAAVFLAIATTTSMFAAQAAEGIPGYTLLLSVVLFAVFLTLASTVTWPAAARLGGGQYPAAQYRTVSRRLGRFHLLFVIMLMSVAALQAFGVS